MGIEINVAANGRMSIPADVRKRLGLENGGKLNLQMDEFGVTLTTFKQRLAKARTYYAEISKGHPPIDIDEFIAEKRADAALEKY
ncbi:MAG: AbrB/MazE/SpoVT family DNA-binding domain-containing protein [Sphingorhabdus sp.]